jgi:hypothetical protein
MPITLTSASPSGTDLISTDRAALNDTLSALNTSSPDALAALISAASQAIERACKREFTLQAYTEVYNGEGMPYMMIHLANFPVVEITRIATSPQAVVEIKNTSSSNQRATVATTSTGLRLVRVASAVPTTSDLAFATYTTLTTLVAAVNALSNGWSASVVSPYGAFPSADLLPLQGAATALNGGTKLEMYTEDSPAWGSSGIWTSPWGYVGDGPGWRLDAGPGKLIGAWPQGLQNIRIDYRAGFEIIPAPIQEACVQHVQDLYQAGLVNGNLKSATIGPYKYELDNTARKVSLSNKVLGLIGPYIDFGKMHGRRGPDYT